MDASQRVADFIRKGTYQDGCIKQRKQKKPELFSPALQKRGWQRKSCQERASCCGSKAYRE
jgi:hypothetical protein